MQHREAVNNGPIPQAQSQSQSSFESDEISAYTDAASEGGPWGGCALYYGENDPRNVFTKTQPVDEDIVELVAIDRALTEFRSGELPSRLVPGTIDMFGLMREVQNGWSEMDLDAYPAQTRAMLERIRANFDALEANGRWVKIGMQMSEDDQMANFHCRRLATEVSEGTLDAHLYELP